MHANPGEDTFQTAARLDEEYQPPLYRLNNTINRTVDLNSLLHDMLWISRLLIGDRWPLIVMDQVVLFGLPKDQRLTYDWHQESNYIPDIAPIVNYWFPIFEPATKSNGAMSLLESSHKLGRLPYNKSENATNAYVNLNPIDAETIQAKHTEIWCELDPCYLVVFHEDMLHRSNFNHTEHTRFSGVIRVCAIREQVPERLEDFREVY